MILRAENLAKNIQRSVVKGTGRSKPRWNRCWLGDSNGAGKTTPLYDCGLVKPNSGNIYPGFGYIDIRVQRAQQGIDILAQEAPFWKLSWRQYLECFATNYSSKEEQAAKMESQLKNLVLEHIRTIAFYCLEENVLKLHDAWLPILNYLTWRTFAVSILWL
jgi:ABC-type lipopolysaccharide export system ATPase subunit